MYSAALKQAIGAVRATFTKYGLTRQSPVFTQHGAHKPADDAPLVLVACSGGRDSLALAAVCQIVCASWGLRAGAVVIDHNLQEGSHEVAKQAAIACVDIGLHPVALQTIEVPASPDGVEAAARKARYDELCFVAGEVNASAVLLAHTKDDQAETILIDLIRSASTDALAGMKDATEVDGVRFLRPLLTITREQTTQICKDLSLDYWDDPTNGDDVPADVPLDDSYPLRSRIRHTLIPMINEFAHTNIVDRLASASDVARLDVDYLDKQADEAWRASLKIILPPCILMPGEKLPDTGVLMEFDIRKLVYFDPAIRRRMFARVLARHQIRVNAQQIARIDELISNWHGQQGVQLPEHITVKRTKHVIEVCQDIVHADCRYR